MAPRTEFSCGWWGDGCKPGERGLGGPKPLPVGPCPLRVFSSPFLCLIIQASSWFWLRSLYKYLLLRLPALALLRKCPRLPGILASAAESLSVFSSASSPSKQHVFNMTARPPLQSPRPLRHLPCRLSSRARHPPPARGGDILAWTLAGVPRASVR